MRRALPDAAGDDPLRCRVSRAAAQRGPFRNASPSKAATELRRQAVVAAAGDRRRRAAQMKELEGLVTYSGLQDTEGVTRAQQCGKGWTNSGERWMQNKLRKGRSVSPVGQPKSEIWVGEGGA
jgi:hypothetical protein